MGEEDGRAPADARAGERPRERHDRVLVVGQVALPVERLTDDDQVVRGLDGGAPPERRRAQHVAEAALGDARGSRRRGPRRRSPCSASARRQSPGCSRARAPDRPCRRRARARWSAALPAPSAARPISDERSAVSQREQSHSRPPVTSMFGWQSIVKARTASSAAASVSSAPSSSRRAWPAEMSDFACASSVVASHALEV